MGPHHFPFESPFKTVKTRQILRKGGAFQERDPSHSSQMIMDYPLGLVCIHKMVIQQVFCFVELGSSFYIIVFSFRI